MNRNYCVVWKDYLFFLVFFLIIFIVVLIIFYSHSLIIIKNSIDNSKILIDEKHFIRYNNFGFYPVNEQGIYSFWNVCIEEVGITSQYPKEQKFKEVKYNETRRIAVYNSFYRTGDQVLNVAGSGNGYRNFWEVKFFRKSFPKSYTFYNVTAFFVEPTCPSNFHHFWIDEFVPLFTVVKQANRLKKNSNSRIFYRHPNLFNLNLSSDVCTDFSTFHPILFTLSSIQPSVFYEAPTNSCYSSAVFGTKNLRLSDPRTVITHVIDRFPYKSKVKHGKKMGCEVLFMERTYRRILNIDRLIQVVKELGYEKVCKMNFGLMSVEEQMMAASSARVMVGVHGAGLQWAVFMPPNSSLIEVAWPQKSWGFYFETFIKPYKIKCFKIIAYQVFPNWNSYEKNVRNGKVVSKEERKELIKPGKGLKNPFDNLWKWADINLDENDFKDLISTII